MPKEELEAFGWWFAGGKFDPAWSFRQMETTLKRTNVGQSSMHLCDRLSVLVTEYPTETLDLLRLFIDKTEHRWLLSGTEKREGVRNILEMAINSPHTTVREQAKDIVHLLGSKGYFEYRELLDQIDPLTTESTS